MCRTNDCRTNDYRTNDYGKNDYRTNNCRTNDCIGQMMYRKNDINPLSQHCNKDINGNCSGSLLN